MNSYMETYLGHTYIHTCIPRARSCRVPHAGASVPMELPPSPHVDVFTNPRSSLNCVIWGFFFFSPLFGPPDGLWSSQARHQIQAAVATYTTAVAMLDPLTHCTRRGWGSSPCPRAAETPLILLNYGGSSSLQILMEGIHRIGIPWG